ncbi:MAG TPA: replication-relaxation family protein [Longimicrobium sp.]|nr:replication-relaxation family protein [Longimicrobium sp.]
MPGTRRGFRIILQERDQKLLSALDTMRIVDRRQAMVLMGFTSISRVNARLLQLTRAGIVIRDYIPAQNFGRKAVYRRTGSRRVTERAAPHLLAINEVELALRESFGAALRKVQRFSQPIVPGVPLIPDAYVEIGGASIHPIFIEVDLGSEPRSVWRLKAQAYLSVALSGAFEEAFQQPRFRVAVVASSERRLNSIRQAVRTETDRLFFFSTFESINSDGVRAAIWLRPEGSKHSSLI